MIKLSSTLKDYDWICIVPAGGLGSRLGKLTEKRAKPSLAVAFDETGAVTRMIDIPLRAVKAAGGGALVSRCFASETLDFVHDYDHVRTVSSCADDSPIDTLLYHYREIEDSRAEHIGILPADTNITAATLERMRIILDISGADAVLLSTRHLEGHNVRSMNKDGTLHAPNTDMEQVGDLGVHLFKREWLLDRLRRCREEDPNKPREVWHDIYDVQNPKGRIYLYIPEHDLIDVDMGTPAAFKKMVTEFNARHQDKNGNIVFPGASIHTDSTGCIALPGSVSAATLTGVILPENTIVTAHDDCLKP
jgi:hypothetical protein